MTVEIYRKCSTIVRFVSFQIPTKRAGSICGKAIETKLVWASNGRLRSSSRTWLGFSSKMKKKRRFIQQSR